MAKTFYEPDEKGRMRITESKGSKKPYLREDAVKNSIFLEDINRNPIKKKLGPNNVNEV